MKRSLLIALFPVLALMAVASTASADEFDFYGKVLCINGNPVSGAVVHVQYMYQDNNGYLRSFNRDVVTNLGRWHTHIDGWYVFDYRATYGDDTWYMGAPIAPGQYSTHFYENCETAPHITPTGEKSDDDDSELRSWGSLKALFK